LNWKDLLNKKIKPEYIPVIQYIHYFIWRSDYDTSNFATYPDSTELPDAVK